MQPERFLLSAAIPATDWLTDAMGHEMGEHDALVQLLAIALQESGLTARRQVLGQGRYGRGRGWPQFEGGPGEALDLVMRNPIAGKIARLACEYATVPFDLASVYEAVAWHDWLSVVMARLLLWLDPHPTPALGEVDKGWACYLRNWQPGKPHPEVWPRNYGRAFDALANVSATPERFGEETVSTRAPTGEEIATYLASQSAITGPLLPSSKEIAAAAVQREAVTKRSIVVSSAGADVVAVDPPQIKNAWKRGSTYLSLLVAALPYIAQALEPFIDPAAAALGQTSWAQAFGPLAGALIFASSNWLHGQALKVAGQAVTAKLDPVGAPAAPTELPPDVTHPLINEQFRQVNEQLDELRRSLKTAADLKVHAPTVKAE